MTDLGNEEEVEEIAKKHAVQAYLEQEELRLLLSQKAMRRFVWTLLCECGINRIPFHGEATHDTAFACGEQNIGHKLNAMIDAMEAHTYMAIYTEFRKDEEENE